jgi:hypothetical protein
LLYAAQEFSVPLLPLSKAKNSYLSHWLTLQSPAPSAQHAFQARGLGVVGWNSGALITQIHWLCDLNLFFCNFTKGKC